MADNKILVSLNGYKIKDTDALTNATVSGKTLTIKRGDTTVATLDASYAEATTAAAGLMSATDKALLDGLGSTGGQPNIIETVKVKTSSTNTTTLTPDSNKAVTVDVSGKADKGSKLSDYGILDAKIAGGVITLGSNTITPITDVSDKASLSGATFTGTVKAPNPAAELSDDTVATTKFVKDAIGTLSGAMLFKGTIGTSGTVTALPAKHNVGDTYKVITAGTYAGQKCEIGDMIICITDGTAANNAHWTVVQNNIDIMTGATSSAAGAAGMVPAPAVANKDQFLRGDGTWATPADTTYAAGTGLSLSGTTFNHSNSVTAATNVGSNTAGAVAFGGSIVIPKISYDAQGHITATGTTTVNLPANPNTDTKVTSVGNHYTPTENAGSALSASTTAAASDIAASDVAVVTGLKRDAAGHVTGIVSTKLKATNTTYDDFTGATATAAGTHGLVPAPAAGANTKLLVGDGTWKALVLNVDADGNGTLGLQ